MDGIANVARQQQSQVNPSETQGRVAHVEQQVHQTQQPKSEENVVKELQTQAANNSKKLNTKEDVQDIVDKLNKAMAPINTDLKFGVDQQDVFYVSVIDTKSNKMIRRFPAEKAADFLPKMQEVSGILFDSRG